MRKTPAKKPKQQQQLHHAVRRLLSAVDRAAQAADEARKAKQDFLRLVEVGSDA